MTRLDSNPIRINVPQFDIFAENPFTGDYRAMLLDGTKIVDILFFSLYDTDTIPWLPLLIFTTSHGSYDLVEHFAGWRILINEYLSWGMHFSVQCNEEVPFIDPEAIAAANKIYPRLEKHFGGDLVSSFCDSWSTGEVDPTENQTVTSNIPTLILAGEYDPVTPPFWGKLAKTGLSASMFYQFPGLGHGVGRTGGCPLSIALSFLEKPDMEPNASCISKMSAPSFVTP